MHFVYNNRRYESSGHLIGNEYFLHAHGPIYALSADIVAALASARNDRSVISYFAFFNFCVSLIRYCEFLSKKKDHSFLDKHH